MRSEPLSFVKNGSVNSGFVDSHCHLDFPVFDQDRIELWRRCQKLGVSSALVPGVSPDQWVSARDCSQQLSGVVYAVGLHPWWLKNYSENLNNNIEVFLDDLFIKLEPFAKEQPCVAIGECGLDQSIATPMVIQEQVLLAHIRWCNVFKLPIVLHCYKAHADLLRVLKQSPVERGGVVHAFAGSVEIAKAYSSLGFCLGAGGVLTYPRANKTRKAFASLPQSAILLETDAPDMPVNGRQGERNSPEHIPMIARSLAELRDEKVNEVKAYTSKNFQRLFLNAQF